MDYNKLTKAQLIERVQELEKQTVQYKLESFVIESQLLIEDLYKAIQFVYTLGCKTRRAVQEVTLPVIKKDHLEVSRLLSTTDEKNTLNFNY